jgi:hypothetical protein
LGKSSEHAGGTARAKRSIFLQVLDLAEWEKPWRIATAALLLAIVNHPSLFSSRRASCVFFGYFLYFIQ